MLVFLIKLEAILTSECKNYRGQPSTGTDLHDQVFSEFHGCPGGMCRLRFHGCEASDKNAKLPGFYYDDGDSCWRCDGSTLIGKASFANDMLHWMLPPFALDNNDWKLRPDWANFLPRRLAVCGQEFLLAGVTMAKPGHFTSLILVENEWYFYDGLQGAGYLETIDSFKMKNLSSFLCYAFYLAP